MSTPPAEPMRRHAVLSGDGTYRWILHREWDAYRPPATFIMLNPSTADANVDDPTIRRCIAYARSWGCGALTVVNLYAYRATDPAALQARPPNLAADHKNITYILAALDAARHHHGPVVAAWGTHAPLALGRLVADAAAARGMQLQALHITRSGAPGHPLYLRADAPLQPWPATP